MRISIFLAALLIASALPHGSQAQPTGNRDAKPRPLFSTNRQKPVNDLLKKQDPPKISPRLLKGEATGPIQILISISKQRLYFIVGGETLIDSPVSTGKRVGMTPTGNFVITQKNADHRSSIYGSFVDSRGRVVRSGVSTKKDSAPAGTRYVGAPMKYFMRLTDTGVGMHVGELPGYPASHGCIRLPEEVAKLIFERVALQQPVTITE